MEKEDKFRIISVVILILTFIVMLEQDSICTFLKIKINAISLGLRFAIPFMVSVFAFCGIRLGRLKPFRHFGVLGFSLTFFMCGLILGLLAQKVPIFDGSTDTTLLYYLSLCFIVLSTIAGTLIGVKSEFKK